MNVLGKIADITGLRRQVEEATSTVARNLQELRGAVAAKCKERDYAKEGPLPPAEVVAKFNAWVDQTAAQQRKDSGPSLVLHQFGSPPGHSGGGSPWTASTKFEWGYMAWFFGDVLKQRFAELVEQTEYQPGPPAAERAGVVARLEQEVAELVLAEEAMVDEMNAAGITVAHRPEVIQRREAERRNQEWVDRQAADRRDREAAIDQRHAVRSTVSPYIAAHQAERRALRGE